MQWSPDNDQSHVRLFPHKIQRGIILEHAKWRLGYGSHPVE